MHNIKLAFFFFFFFFSPFFPKENYDLSNTMKANTSKEEKKYHSLLIQSNSAKPRKAYLSANH